MQCANGHTLCHNCKEQVNHRCPTCRVLLNFNIRCLALEKVAESLEMPCKFSKQGCHEVRTFYDKVSAPAGVLLGCCTASESPSASW